MNKLLGKQVKVLIDCDNKHNLNPVWNGRVGVVGQDMEGECSGDYEHCAFVVFTSGAAPFFLDELRYLNNHKVVL